MLGGCAARVGVVVFGSDVLIGFLNADDAHHPDAIAWMTTAMRPGARRMLSAVNYSEVLIGPIRAGRREVVDRMLAKFNIETMVVDRGRAAGHL